MKNDLVEYYRQRAPEYDRLYTRPDRQAALELAKKILKHFFKDLHCLEIACGTGYWTGAIAETACSVVATDINEEMLRVAAGRLGGLPNVRLAAEDFNHPASSDQYDALFGGFIWSHIPLAELQQFVNLCRTRVKAGGTIVFMDNLYVKGCSLPIAETDEHGNTFQVRKLDDGTEHKVMKNFPSASFLREQLEVPGNALRYEAHEYYWIASCRV